MSACNAHCKAGTSTRERMRAGSATLYAALSGVLWYKNQRARWPYDKGAKDVDLLACFWSSCASRRRFSSAPIVDRRSEISLMTRFPLQTAGNSAGRPLPRRIAGPVWPTSPLLLPGELLHGHYAEGGSARSGLGEPQLTRMQRKERELLAIVRISASR